MQKDFLMTENLDKPLEDFREYYGKWTFIGNLRLHLIY